MLLGSKLLHPPGDHRGEVARVELFGIEVAVGIENTIQAVIRARS